jgi:hypothetical protein
MFVEYIKQHFNKEIVAWGLDGLALVPGGQFY